MANTINRSDISKVSQDSRIVKWLDSLQQSAFNNPFNNLDNLATLNFANDSAAAAGGVPLHGIYHNAGTLRIRLT